MTMRAILLVSDRSNFSAMHVVVTGCVYYQPKWETVTVNSKRSLLKCDPRALNHIRQVQNAWLHHQSALASSVFKCPYENQQVRSR
jgi:hypothetical protein